MRFAALTMERRTQFHYSLVHTSTGLERDAVVLHAVRVSFPARCLHFAAKVRVTASAQRDFAHSWFEDDSRAVTVRRG